MEKYTFKIVSMDLENAGYVSSRIKKILISKGIDRQIIRRVAIASYEAEINVVIHSYGGNCLFQIDDKHLTLDFIDCGPGIVSIQDAMKEGWSTASQKDRENGFGAGMGFPNILKASDKLDIESSKAGTKVSIFFSLEVKNESM